MKSLKGFVVKEEIDEILNVEINSFRDISGIVNNLVINKQTGSGNSEYIKNLFLRLKKMLLLI